MARDVVDCSAGAPALRPAAPRRTDEVPASAAVARWFVDPLPFAKAYAASNPPREKRKGPDYVAILSRQGFDAVKGVGGAVVFDDAGHALRHHTMVYAPPLPGREPFAPTRFNLAARMLQFADAASIQRMVLEAQRRLLGPEHPNTLLSAGNLGSSLALLGACDEAEQLLQSVLASYKRLGLTEHMDLFSRTLAMAQARKAALFPADTRVHVRGLVSKPEYNGKAARVVAFDAQSGRHRVVLDDGKELLVKAACLERDV
jgi:hypothetical protein